MAFSQVIKCILDRLAQPAVDGYQEIISNKNVYGKGTSLLVCFIK